MSARLPEKPAHPERVCWGCNRFCPIDNLVCGSEVERAPHPIELFGDDWKEWAERNNGQPEPGSIR